MVISADPTPWFHTVTINKGAEDGVTVNMAVIAPQGVVGRIVGEVAPRAARVQLLIDRNAAAGAMIERSRAAGVVVGGTGDPPLIMEYVSNQADVKIGDTVVASGIDGIFPRGFVIGRIVLAEPGRGGSRTIRVQPAVDFALIEEVLVVLTPPGAPPPKVEGTQ
jgi:rod shape-determining protein MreC